MSIALLLVDYARNNPFHCRGQKCSLPFLFQRERVLTSSEAEVREVGGVPEFTTDLSALGSYTELMVWVRWLGA